MINLELTEAQVTAERDDNALSYDNLVESTILHGSPDTVIRKIEDGKKLEVVITVDDPETYNQTWQAMRRYDITSDDIGENICQEGNFVLFDYGIPVANKRDF